jgi:hypothetical protein
LKDLIGLLSLFAGKLYLWMIEGGKLWIFMHPNSIFLYGACHNQGISE